jgi:hypothetical protein
VLHRGVNCLAVLVQHQGVQHSTRGGLLAEVTDSADQVLCASGEIWKCSVGIAWRSDSHFVGMNRIGPFQEHLDLRKLPRDWNSVGFDDRQWDKPMVISGRHSGHAGSVMPWCRLLPRDIAYLEEKTVLPSALQMMEECLDLENRMRSSDLSISLSQVGRPLDWAKISDTDNLLTQDGETVFACSDRHEDRVTDGRYDPCLTLDFGRVLTAYAEIEAFIPEGAIIEVGYAERLVDGRFNNAIECSFADCVIGAGEYITFRPLVWRSFRYLRIRIKSCQQELRLQGIRAVEVKYPYEQRGAFCGDKRFEQIFAICRTTVELCSIESIMDTPFREQAQWLGDVAAVTVPCIYACFGDTALPRKFLQQAAMNTRPSGLIANISNVADTGWQSDIPDYSLWWVIALWKYYLYSGDEECLHICYPEMQRIMRVHIERIGASGLLGEMFGWVFIDWAHVDNNGMSAAYNAIFAGACDAAQSIATVKQDAWAQVLYANAAKGIRAAFAETFASAENGLMVDAVSDEGSSPRYSEHANAAAIAFDCVDATTAQQIVSGAFEHPAFRLTEAQPFFMVVVLEALRKTGRRDLALQLIDARWGKRMVDRGRTSCTEEWYENGSWRSGEWKGFERTHSHAWSACPAEFLTVGLVGFEILEAGAQKIRIDPYHADFSYDVVCPTVLGDVCVHWDGQVVTVEAPDCIEVVMPS